MELGFPAACLHRQSHMPKAKLLPQAFPLIVFPISGNCTSLPGQKLWNHLYPSFSHIPYAIFSASILSFSIQNVSITFLTTLLLPLWTTRPPFLAGLQQQLAKVFWVCPWSPRVFFLTVAKVIILKSKSRCVRPLLWSLLCSPVLFWAKVVTMANKTWWDLGPHYPSFFFFNIVYSITVVQFSPVIPPLPNLPPNTHSQSLQSCPCHGSFIQILWLIPSPSFHQFPLPLFPLAAVSIFHVSMFLVLFCSWIYCVD